ncbi:MAG: hypothetical protein LBP64_01025 [Tannerella sp.]|nr:hypothetical protein [Tannerella sp.]
MKIIELLNMRDWISTEPFTAFMMLLFAAHLLYPFKRVNKNLRQHVNFFLFFAVLLSLAITGFMILIGLNMR